MHHAVNILVALHTILCGANLSLYHTVKLVGITIYRKVIVTLI